MKKTFLVISLFVMSLFVVACGTTNNGNEKPADNQIIEDNNNAGTKGTNGNTGTNGTEAGVEGTNNNSGQQSGSNGSDEAAKMDALDYTEFSLDIDYGNHKDYDVELEREENGFVEAKLEDDTNGIKKRGSEAFNEIYPLVEQLTITQDTTKEEAIKEVLDVFKQDANYQKFELEITFKDGTKIEFEDRK
ncbi:YusW family protein [Sporosarcina pasteurii]|uniref:YusW-like protein n=1 Tax=Sporosarcina pasteurii TaxID=1474 RepID=A0A380C6M3_SPOPA|nr:YusW family protein [Sporosarcina pasteurii]MDS9473044.1 YusW family protein [Sporosarcina pasteurii]QBQ04553.1 hypothetical protein E2C16_02130 [Sporosarcina pasteurii]SUJ14181.1 Uncharacterised protein [Sporosarcina pasteurii]